MIEEIDTVFKAQIKHWMENDVYEYKIHPINDKQKLHIEEKLLIKSSRGSSHLCQCLFYKNRSYLILQYTLNVLPEEENIVLHSKEKRRQFLLKLSEFAALKDYYFEYQFKKNHPEDNLYFFVYTRMYYEGLTRAKFFTMLDKMNNSSEFLYQLYNFIFGPFENKKTSSKVALDSALYV